MELAVIWWTLAVVLLWTAEALLLARWMARHGHDLALWLVLGLVMGPLAVGLAFMASTEADLRARRASKPSPQARRGPIDVLVGLDGSPQSEAALAAALELFESRLGRVTVVSVIDLDLGQDPATREIADHLTLGPSRDRLERLAETGVRINSTVVAGRASQELARLAAEGSYDAVIVGARGHGLSELLVGSTVEELLRISPIPVLVGPAPVDEHLSTEGEASAPHRSLV